MSYIHVVCHFTLRYVGMYARVIFIIIKQKSKTMPLEGKSARLYFSIDEHSENQERAVKVQVIH